METFEFLNIAQIYGLPRIMGVLTHMDLYKKMNKQLNKRKTEVNEMLAKHHSYLVFFYSYH